MDRPALTIGLPVHNGEEFLQEAIDSVLAQSHHRWELVIADNASTDATPEIARAVAENDARVRYLPSLRNQGSAWNWNRCVREARGPLFQWLCHDDRLAPHHTSTALDAICHADDNAVLAYPDCVIIDAAGIERGNYADPVDLTSPSVGRRMESIMTSLVLINPLLGVIRTDVLKTTRGMQAFGRADVVLLLELMLRGRAVKITEPLFYRRRHEGGSMAANPTSAQLDRFYGASADANPWPTWRLVGSYLRAVRDAPLPAHQRLSLAPLVGKTMYRKQLLPELASAATNRDARRHRKGRSR